MRAAVVFGVVAACSSVLHVPGTRWLPSAIAADGPILNETLTLEEATSLVEKRSTDTLSLDALRSLTPDVAIELAKHTGNLSLNGLVELTPATAEAIATHRGSLSLNGVKAVSAEVATNLSKHQGEGLELCGVTTLTPEAAASLAKHGGVLVMTGLADLTSPELAAKFIAPGYGGSVRFKHLHSLSDEAARVLAQQERGKYGNYLTFCSLDDLSEEAATALAAHKGNLVFERLARLTPGAAKALAKRDGDLILGVDAISDEVAEALSSHTGQLSLGVDALSDKAAQAIARHRGGLKLDKLTTLSDTGIQELCQSAGVVELPAYKDFSNVAVLQLIDVAVARGRQVSVPLVNPWEAESGVFLSESGWDSLVSDAVVLNTRRGATLRQLIERENKRYASIKASDRPLAVTEVFEGLKGLRLGMTPNEVAAASPVALIALRRPSGMFAGAGLSGLGNKAFPLADDVAAPVEFVFRNDKLVGIVADGGQPGLEGLAAVMQLLISIHGDMKPVLNRDSHKVAIRQFIELSKHEPITFASQGGVRLVLEWSPATEASFMRLVLDGEKEPGLLNGIRPGQQQEVAVGDGHAGTKETVLLPKFRLEWDDVQKITGPECRTTIYRRNRDETLRRIEVFDEGSGNLLLAVTEVEGGFRFTVGSEVAIAGLAVRPIFSAAESEGIIELFAAYLAKKTGGEEEKPVGRLRINVEPDPEQRKLPSMIIKPAT